MTEHRLDADGICTCPGKGGTHSAAEIEANDGHCPECGALVELEPRPKEGAEPDGTVAR
jgi:hypothetical protein